MAFLNILTLIFIVLKLTDYIDWSWWFVLMPTAIHILLIITGTIVFILSASSKKRY